MTIPARTSILGLLLALATAAGCGVIRLGDLDPPEGRRIIVEVEIIGVDGLSEGAIADVLASYEDNLGIEAPKPLLDRAKLPSDARRIESYYAENGYFEAHVRDWRVLEVGPGLAGVRFSVDEGPPTLVQELDFGPRLTDGVPAEEQETLLRLTEVQEDLGELAQLQVGRRWRSAAYEEGKGRIRSALRGRGFLYAEVLGRIYVLRESQEAYVRYDIIPGPLARLRGVRITGNDRIATARIMRRVDLEEGQLVRPADLRRIEANIYDLRAFYGVHAEVARKSQKAMLGGEPMTPGRLRELKWPAEVDVVIDVQEMPVHELLAGVGVTADSERSELYLRGGYQNRSFLGGLRYLKSEIRPAFVGLPSFFTTDALLAFAGKASLTFRQPSFVEEYLVLGLGLDYELDVEQGYKSHKVEFSPTISRRFFGFLGLTFGYNITYYNYFDTDDVLDLSVADTMGLDFRDTYLLSYLEQTIEVDLRDVVFDPRRGVYGQIRVSEAVKAIGSDFAYWRLAVDLRGYVSPWSFLTVAAQIRYGQVFSPFGSVNPMPVRFKAGGPTDMRGYGAGRIGPSICERGGEQGGSSGDCTGSRVFVGGELMLVGGFELRFRLPASFGVVTFVDAGEVWPKKEDIDLSTIKVAVGPGLRYFTPFGPIRFDLGVRVTEPQIGSVTYHISIGQAF